MFECGSPGTNSLNQFLRGSVYVVRWFWLSSFYPLGKDNLNDFILTNPSDRLGKPEDFQKPFFVLSEVKLEAYFVKKRNFKSFRCSVGFHGQTTQKSYTILITFRRLVNKKERKRFLKSALLEGNSAHIIKNVFTSRANPK